MNSIDLSCVTTSKPLRRLLGAASDVQLPLELLGHGEYNLNYRLTHPATGEELVLRIPMGSQMSLSRQARYEFRALQLLEPTGRTPKPYCLDEASPVGPYGFLVMELLPGRALRYEEDLAQAAACLAEIHGQSLPEDHGLLSPPIPMAAMLEECRAMAGRYLESGLAVPGTKKRLLRLLKRGASFADGPDPGGRRCLVNTELNSGNFLVGDGGKTCLIDWEKPLYAHPGQDLGHFLAPTTTLWRTQAVLGEGEILSFLQSYCNSSHLFRNPEALWEETRPYLALSCLRGITWCAMAWVEYQTPGRALKDPVAFGRIQAYLTDEFLEGMERGYLGG